MIATCDLDLHTQTGPSYSKDVPAQYQNEIQICQGFQKLEHDRQKVRPMQLKTYTTPHSREVNNIVCIFLNTE